MQFSDLVEQLDVVAAPSEISSVINLLGIKLEGEGAYATIKENDVKLLNAIADYAISNEVTLTDAAQEFIKQQQQHQAKAQSPKKKGFDRDLFNLQTLGVTEETAAPGSLQSLIIKDQKNLGNHIAAQRHTALMTYTDALLTSYLVNGVEEGAESNAPLLKSEEFLTNTVLGVINLETSTEQLQSLLGGTQLTNALPGA